MNNIQKGIIFLQFLLMCSIIYSTLIDIGYSVYGFISMILLIVWAIIPIVYIEKIRQVEPEYVVLIMAFGLLLATYIMFESVQLLIGATQ